MAPFTARVFAAGPALRLVAVCRGGPVNVDLAAATRPASPSRFAPGRNAAAAAEFAVGLMLAALRRIPAADAELKRAAGAATTTPTTRRGDGTGRRHRRASSATAPSAAIVARVLRAFGAHVLVADPYADPDAVPRRRRRAGGARRADAPQLPW